MTFQQVRDFFSVKFSTSRIYGLDILRALAILEVVFAHGQTLLPKEFGVIHKYLGFDGVTLFFVLSGFLIGQILIKTVEKGNVNRNALFHFWNRRWYRTLPNYYLILLILICYYTFVRGSDLLDKLPYFIFSQNLFYNHPGFFGEAWSLSIEEWFYFLIPILIFLLIGRFKVSTKRSFLIAASSVIIIVFLFRLTKFYYLTSQGIDDFDVGKAFGMQVFTRLDSIMYGILGAYTFKYFPDYWNKNPRLLLWFGVLLVIGIQALKLSIDQRSFFWCVALNSLLPFSFLCLFPFFNGIKAGHGRIYRMTTVISLISYSMYLLNLSIVYHILLQITPWDNFNLSSEYLPFLKFIMFWILTVLLSILLYKFYEVPMTALRANKRTHI